MQAINPSAQFGDDEAALANQRALMAQLGQPMPNKVAPQATASVAPSATIDLGPREPFPDGNAGSLYGADKASAPSGMEAGKYSGSLQGFEPSKMNAEHAAKSPKYAFALIAQDYPATPEGLKAMAQDPRFAAAGLQYVGGDKIMAPDPDNGGKLGPVDVGKAFDAGGQGWQWGAEGGAQGGGYSGSLAGAMNGQAPTPLTSSMVPTDQDFFNKLIEQMRNGSSGDVLDQLALSQQLR